MVNIELRQWIENSTNFTQVEDTLVIRYGNILSQEHADAVYPESFNVWWHKVHSVHKIKSVLVIWNLGEIAVPIPEEAKQIIVDSVKQYIGDVPVTFIVPNTANDSTEHVGIEPFEILSQLQYDMFPDVHQYEKWNPEPQNCLFLVGKLRVHRYYFLKYMLEHLPPEQFQYVLNRRTFNGVVYDRDDEVQFGNWVNSTKENLQGILPLEEIREFLRKNETPVYDNISFKMIDKSQMISDRMMRETSLSLVTETSEWASKFLSEKTFLCVATGRPFILWHNNEANQYLESRGYKLYADYNPLQDWQIHREIKPGTDYSAMLNHLEYYADSVKHFLDTCKQNKDEINDKIRFNQRKLKRNTNADLYKISEVFPMFESFSTEQKVRMLLCCTEATDFYK